MSDFLLTMAQFHFLRPWWLLAIPLALIFVILFWRKKGSAINWGKAINQELLSHLVEDSHKSFTSSRWPWLLLFITWCIAAFALAGPAWQKLPQPVHQKQDALVIVLDLSLSMYSEDIKPSRLIRARHKVIDVLKARNEGLSALIAYSRDAHVASPLTDDNNTVANLVPALTPEMMPALGSNPKAGIASAIELLQNTGLTEGRILLISDGISEKDANSISDLLSGSRYELSIMAVATTAGAPIPLSKGFVKDNSGAIVTPKLDRAPFQTLAAETNGRYIETRLDDSDIDFLLPQSLQDLNTATRETQRQFDQWQDQGAYLCLLLLPLTLLCFRRGWLLTLPLLLTLQPETSHALSWQDLWQTKDQQAMALLQQGNSEQAAETFTNPQWQAAANYKAEKFEQATKQYAEEAKSNASATSHYNYANSLAKSGKLDEAIKHYDQALEINPEFEDAAFNKKVVEQAKQQQQQQQNNDQQDQNDDQKENQDQQQDQNSDNESSDNKNPEDNQNQDQENKQDQQNKDENSSDPEKDQQQDKQDESKDKPEEESPKNNEQPEQQQADKKPEQQEKEQAQQQALKEAAQKEADQQEKATEQWLRQIPDDPSGLLRRKFDYEYRLKKSENNSDQEDQPLW